MSKYVAKNAKHESGPLVPYVENTENGEVAPFEWPESAEQAARVLDEGALFWEIFERYPAVEDMLADPNLV